MTFSITAGTARVRGLVVLEETQVLNRLGKGTFLYLLERHMHCIYVYLKPSDLSFCHSTTNVYTSKPFSQEHWASKMPCPWKPESKKYVWKSRAFEKRNWQHGCQTNTTSQKEKKSCHNIDMYFIHMAMYFQYSISSVPRKHFLQSQAFVSSLCIMLLYT